MHPVISSLFENGETLARLLQKAKSQTQRENSTTTKQESPEIIHEDVRKVVHDVLEKLESPQLPAFFPETIIPNVVDKIQDTLHQFIKRDTDNASKYEDLAKIVKVFKSKKQSSAIGSFSLQSQQSESLSVYLVQREASLIDNPQEDQFKSLLKEEKICLFCFCLFSAGKEIKKRELIHLWIGMDLINNTLQGDEILAKLVAEGFVERIIGKKKLFSRYLMNETVHSMVVQQLTAMNSKFIDGSLSILILQQQQETPPQQSASKDPTTAGIQRALSRVQTMITRPHQEDKNLQGTLVLNTSESTLGSTTLRRLSERKNAVKVLHLGNWDHNPKRYIMVEDIEVLKALIKSMAQVTFLSLEGISGIVELPDSVYKLEHLKVLDLRACPNLESLSEGIDSLKHLTHLDLSKCYLLAHIPRGIASLTKLRVLKGFVINPNDPQEANGKEITVSSSALFSDVSELTNLVKLTIRTRRMNFPTSDDFGKLCLMKKLEMLRIAWVGSSVDDPSESASGTFPPSLKKLELQAAPENTLSRLLRLISEDTQNSLEKLYIKGGRLWNLGMEMHCFQHVHTVRLTYLPVLRIDWDEFTKFFPKLTRLEVSKCPNLIFFPCDENGVWEETKTTHSDV